MSNEITAFCISCAREFYPGSPEVLLCPDCGGPPEVVAPEPLLSMRTLLDSTPSASNGVRTLLEPQATPPISRDTILEPSPGRSFSESDVPAEWQSGDTLLDTYTVSGLLGEGGMGKVYRVQHKSWNIDLAVKSPRADFFQTQEQRNLFISEAETWVNLGLHPHIVSCYYVRNLGGIPRVFAELVEGGSLADWIEHRKITTVEQALDIAIQFAWGLAYAHEQGVVHRDVKPANVLMTPDGTVKVTDFGLAKAGKGLTPAYASPEQAEAQLMIVELTRQSDLWSWGLSVLEMFAGRAFWVHPDLPDYAWGQVAPQALEHYFSGDLEGPVIAEMPAALAELLRECFQHLPLTRPANLDPVAERLIEIYTAETGHSYPRQQPKPAELRADSLNNKALTMFDLGKKEEAEDTWRQALKIDPHHPEATYNLGIWQWLTGKQTDQELVRQLEAVRTIQMDAMMPHYLLGLAHAQRRDLEAARQSFENAARLMPGSGFVQEKLQEIDEIQPIKHLKTFDVGGDGGVIALAIPPDGRTVVSGSDLDGRVCIWDLRKGKRLRVFKDHKGFVSSIIVTPDGKRFISGSDDNTLRIWDFESRACLHILGGHTNGVNALAVTPDGQMVISGSHDKTLRVWDLASGGLIRTLTGHSSIVYALAITPDGRQIISASHDKTLRVWDLNEGKCLYTLQGHEGPVRTFAINPDGKKIVSGSDDSDLRVWDLASGTCLRILHGHEEYITSLAISSDGRKIVSGSGDYTLRVWDLESGKCIHTLHGHTEQVNTLAITHNARMAISGGDDKPIRIWDLETGICLHTLEGHTSSVYTLSITPDGCQFVSGAGDASIRTWQLPTDGQLATEWAINRPAATRELQSASQRIQLKHQEAMLAIESGKIGQAVKVLGQALETPGFERDSTLLKLWNDIGQKAGRITGVRAAHRTHSLTGHTDTVNALIITPDGSKLISGSDSDDNTIRIWDLESGECLHIITGRRPILTQDGKKLISEDGWYDNPEDNRMRVWDLASGECLHLLEGHTRWIKALALTVDGRRMISGSDDKTLRIWDLESGKCLLTVQGPSGFKHLALTPDGRMVVSGGEGYYKNKESILRLWELDSGRCLNLLEGLNWQTRGVHTIAITPNGKVIAGSLIDSLDRKIRVWDLASGKCLHTLEGHLREVDTISLAPESRAISGSDSSGENVMRLWDLESGQCLHSIQGHTRPLIITSDSRKAISGRGRNQLCIWNLEGGEDIYTIEGQSPVVTTPDEQMIIARTENNLLCIWDLKSGECIYTLEGHKGEVRRLAITPDGRKIISSGNYDQPLIVWNLDWDYRFPEPVEWEEGAKPYLERFLINHTPYTSVLPVNRKPNKDEIALALSQRGVPSWTESDEQQLLVELGHRGYGWIRPEGVRRKLEEMAAERG